MIATKRTAALCLFLGTGFAMFAGALTASASDMGQAAAAQVSLSSYQHYLDDMLYTHFGDNRGFGPEHDLARINIQFLMASFGLSVTLEPVTYQSNTYYNVVGTKLGTLYPDQEYIVGGHYDSVNNPGADDNASGVALVLEAARILTQYDSEYTIRFVAFDREEQGLIGSDQYVDAHIGDDIRGMISADMVAYNNGTNSVDIYGRTASNPIKNALAQSVVTYGDGLGVALNGQFDASDHAPFEWAGFQACLIIEDWGNPYYHTQQDSVDTPNYIDYAFATQITRVVVGYLVDQANVLVTLADGDFDGDDDVDLFDFDAFVACFTGVDGGPIVPGCEPGDFDLDDDIDCADWDQFRSLWTGPPVDVPFLAECDADCNGNSIADDLDIAGGNSADCNANAVPDECDIADESSSDCDVNGVPDECDLAACDGSPACSDCNGNQVLDGCDVTGGSSPDEDGNGVPDECQLEPPVCGGMGSRYLSVTPMPLDLVVPVALYVVGDPTDPDVECVSRFVQPDGALGDTPVYQTPAEWGTVSVFGAAILPETSYGILTVTEAQIWSEPQSALTWKWGDVDQNAVVDFHDIHLVVQGFQHDFSQAILEAVDLYPCIPDADVSFADIDRDVKAFQGHDYWETGCASPCR